MREGDMMTVVNGYSSDRAKEWRRGVRFVDRNALIVAQNRPVRLF